LKIQGFKMPSRAAIIAHHYSVLSGHPSLFGQLEQQICDAHQKGFSVVEITRIIGSKKADYPHAILVRRGAVQPGRRGRPAKGSVPAILSPYLRKRSLSFAKWCAGWNFELTETAEAIVDLSDNQVLNAIRRDFPGCFARMMELKSHADYVRGPRCFSDKLEATVIWEVGRKCYRATKLDDGDVRGYGPIMEIAIKNLKISHNAMLMSNRLSIFFQERNMV
jgi:hypothetical protein